ncbi:MAG: DUF2179 domain-containing protein, partial [Spirochaetaceae bacterium]|nr:DUF2179 domain-containing protein [Spirochaetaceae bacterium]
NAGKFAMIITKHGTQVSEMIDSACARGSTIVPAMGSYTKESKDVVLCACSTKDMIYVEQAVKEADPSAFTIILITWLFVRKKENLAKGVNFTFLYILTAAVCAALACAVVSGIISYFTFTQNVEAGPFDKIIFAFSGDQMGVLASCIIVRIPITVLDRIITTFAGFGISVAYKKLLHKPHIWKAGAE